MKTVAESSGARREQASVKPARPATHADTKPSATKPVASKPVASKSAPSKAAAGKTAPGKTTAGKTTPGKAAMGKPPVQAADKKTTQTAARSPAKAVAAAKPAPAPKTVAAPHSAAKPTKPGTAAAQPRKTDPKVNTESAAPTKPPAKAAAKAAEKAPAQTAAATATKTAPAKPVAAKPAPKATPAAAMAPAPVPTAPVPLAAAAPVAAPRPAPMASPEVRKPNIPERPVRVPSKQETFVEGDHVVYPTHGVGMVERIVVEDIAGHRLELIHITFEENRMTLRVPVTKARTAGLRKLASRKMFDEALAVLKGRARIKRTMWSRRAQEYEAKINSGDPLAIAEVVRDLHRNAGQPDQSFSERQIYEAAMDRLAAELAALDKTDKMTAAVKLADFLKTI